MNKAGRQDERTQIARPLVLYTTGAAWGSDAWAVCALDPALDWCEERDACHLHRRRGPHIAGGLLQARSFVLEREGRAIDIERLDYGSFYCKDIRDLSDDRVTWPDAMVDALSRVDALVFVVDGRVEMLARQASKLRWVERDLELLGRDPRSLPLVFQVDRDDLDPEALVPGRRRVEMDTVRGLFRWPGPTDYIRTITHRREHVFEPLDRALAFADEERQRPKPKRPRAFMPRHELEAQWTSERPVAAAFVAAAIDTLQLASHQPEVALERLVALWCDRREPAVAEAVELLSEQLGPHVPLDEAEQAQVRAFAEAEEDGSAPDVPGDLMARLLATHPRPRQVDTWNALNSALTKLGPDPRIGNACRAWLVDFDRFRKGALWTGRQSVAGLASSQKDPRLLVDLELAYAGAGVVTVLPCNHVHELARDTIAYSLATSLGDEEGPTAWALDATQQAAWHDAIAPLRRRRQTIAEVQEAVQEAAQKASAQVALVEAERGALERGAARLLEAGERSGELIADQLELSLPTTLDAAGRELAYRQGYLRDVADLVDALVPHRCPSMAAHHLPTPVRIERGALRAFACRVNNQRRIRELSGHPAWATVEALRWGSDPFVRHAWIDPGFVLHPAFARLERLEGLDVETLGQLLDSVSVLPWRHVEVLRVLPEQLAEHDRWPQLDSLAIGASHTPDELRWLATCEVGARLRTLTLRDRPARLDAWLGLAAELPQLEHLVILGRHSVEINRRDGELHARAVAGAGAIPSPYRSGEGMCADLKEAFADDADCSALRSLSVEGVERDPVDAAEALERAALARGVPLEGLTPTDAFARLTLVGEKGAWAPGVAAHPNEVLAAFAVGGFESDNVVSVESPDGVVCTAAVPARIVELAFRGDDAVVVLDDEGNIATYDGRTGEVVQARRALRLPEDDSGSLAFPLTLSGDGQRVAFAAGAEPRELIVESTRDGSVLQRLGLDAANLWLDREGRRLARKHTYGQVHVVTVDDGATLLDAKSDAGRLDCALFVGDRLLCGYHGSTAVEVWNLTSGTLETRLRARSMCNGLAVSPDGAWLLMAMGTEIGVWDLEHEREVFTLEACSLRPAFVNDELVALASSHRWARFETAAQVG